MSYKMTNDCIMLRFLVLVEGVPGKNNQSLVSAGTILLY